VCQRLGFLNGPCKAFCLIASQSARAWKKWAIVEGTESAGVPETVQTLMQPKLLSNHPEQWLPWLIFVFLIRSRQMSRHYLDQATNSTFQINHSIVASWIGCLATLVFAEPFPSNDCVCWLHSSCLEQICHTWYKSECRRVFGLMTGFIGFFDTARDCTLHTHTHTHTHIHWCPQSRH
jgi:hypothetical protein